RLAMSASVQTRGVLFLFQSPSFFREAGFKITPMVGSVCWINPTLLFAHSSLDSNLMFVLIGLILQGFCWDFFFTVGDIYVDRKAAPEIKAQAQSLRFIVSNGVGLLFASTVCGQIFNNTVTEQGPQALPQWETFWLVSAGVAAVVSVCFLIFFRDVFSKRKPAPPFTKNPFNP
ncbi:MFS transporter, partial [Escherichia coli]|nr:MFS transporter [Escherichia coli]